MHVKKINEIVRSYSSTPRHMGYLRALKFLEMVHLLLSSKYGSSKLSDDHTCI